MWKRLETWKKLGYDVLKISDFEPRQASSQPCYQAREGLSPAHSPLLTGRSSRSIHLKEPFPRDSAFKMTPDRPSTVDLGKGFIDGWYQKRKSGHGLCLLKIITVQSYASMASSIVAKVPTLYSLPFCHTNSITTG